MNRRDFPGHAAWTETRLNGDHALAFVAIQPHDGATEPVLHQVYHRTHFTRMSDALLAAQDALGKMLHVDEYGQPVFSSLDC